MAGAEVRAILLDLAAKQLGVAGRHAHRRRRRRSRAPDGRKVELRRARRRRSISTARRPPRSRRSRRRSTRSSASRSPRLDIPAKVTGGAAYVQDMRLPGMVHGRVVRPPRYGSRLDSVDEAAVKAMPGVVAVVRDGRFLGVVAEREEQAIKAREALRQQRQVDARAASCPIRRRIYDASEVAAERGHGHRRRSRRRVPAGAKRARGDLSPSPIMAHASIGPSCAVAEFKDGKLTVWTHSPGRLPAARRAGQGARSMPAERRSAASTPKARAATATTAPTTSRSTRRCWRARCRAGRCGCNGCATTSSRGSRTARRWSMQRQGGAVADGKIVDWHYDVWSNTHRHAAGRARRHQSCWRLVPRRAAAAGTAAQASRSRPAAATATPSRSTTSRASGSSTTSSRRCRSASRRCARSAPTPTCSRSNPSWTSWRPRPAPIRSRSASRI